MASKTTSKAATKAKGSGSKGGRGGKKEGPAPALVMCSALSEAAKTYKELWKDQGSYIRISTGFLTLDAITGGGIIEGSIVEGFGREHCGKGTLAKQMASRFVGQDQVGLYVDYEQSEDPAYIRKLTGMDVVRVGKEAEQWFARYQKRKHHPPVMLLAQPECLEEGTNLVCDLVEKAQGQIRYVVHDSLAAMTPRDIVEGQVGDQTIGLQARLLGQFYGKAKAMFRKLGCTLWVVNQVRTKGIGTPFTGEESAGGKATKFYAWQRFKMGGGESHEWSSFLPAGSHCAYLQTVKNKGAEERRGKTKLVIWPGHGFSPQIELLQLMIDHSVLEATGVGQFLFQGAGPYTRRQLLEMLTVHDEREKLQAFFQETLLSKLDGAPAILKSERPKKVGAPITMGESV